MKLRTKLIIAFVVVMIFPVTFALIAMHAFVPGRGAEIQQLYLIAVVLTTAFLILWIYRSVSVPLEKLQRAARNIKEGNLDFEIKAESNDEIGQLCQDFEEMRLRLKAQAEEISFSDENNLQILFTDAVKDAMVIDEEEILPVISLDEGEPYAVYDEDGRILLYTFHKYPDSYLDGTDVKLEWGNVWTFTGGELADWYQKNKETVTDWQTRIKELIGLRPDNESEYLQPCG